MYPCSCPCPCYPGPCLCPRPFPCQLSCPCLYSVRVPFSFSDPIRVLVHVTVSVSVSLSIYLSMSLSVSTSMSVSPYAPRLCPYPLTCPWQFRVCVPVLVISVSLWWTNIIENWNTANKNNCTKFYGTKWTKLHTAKSIQEANIIIKNGTFYAFCWQGFL